MKEDHYVTTDFILGILLSLYFEIEEFQDLGDGRATFVFKRSQSLEKIVADHKKKGIKPTYFWDDIDGFKSMLNLK